MQLEIPMMETDAEARFVELIEQLMRSAVGLTSRAFADCEPDADLPLQQWRALAVVMESGSSGVPVGHLGRRLGVATSGASRVVARLERRGLVTLRRGVADRRMALVHPTDAGRHLWTAIVERRRALIRAALAGADPIVGGEATDVVEALVAAFASEV
jgi:DNA-binding MarR family transcriptional regulator